MPKSKSTDPVYKVLSKDKVIKELLDTLSLDDFSTQPNLYQELTAAIIYQQISTKAADAVYLRFKDAFGWDYTPTDILPLTEVELRPVGLSRQKCQYILNIAEYFNADPSRELNVQELDDDEVIKTLVEIKGVGVWTAKMAMMFYMQRQDVFPYEDLGVRQAMEGLYKIPKENKAAIKTMTEIAEPWKPYRSTASFYLWAWKRAQSKSK